MEFTAASCKIRALAYCQEDRRFSNLITAINQQAGSGIFRYRFSKDEITDNAYDFLIAKGFKVVQTDYSWFVTWV